MGKNKKGLSVCLKVVLALVLCAWFFASNAGAEDKSKDLGIKADLQKMYMDYLQEEGYKPEIDKDGDVGFKKEGRYYYISIQSQEKDTEFFRLVFPKFWKIESDAERVRVLAAANESNSSVKVCKVYTQDDDVWAAAEILVEKPEQAKAVFKRAVSTIENAVSKFVNEMREK